MHFRSHLEMENTVAETTEAKLDEDLTTHASIQGNQPGRIMRNKINTAPSNDWVCFKSGQLACYACLILVAYIFSLEP